jgi:multidrug resistance efflux pump
MRTQITATLIIIGLGLCGSACRKEEAAPPPVLQTVRAAKAQALEPDAPDRYAATISHFAQADLAFKSTGIVERIYQLRGADRRMRNVQAGDSVSPNIELAVVRTTEYQQRIAQSRAQLDQTKAQAAQATITLSQAELDYRRASKLFDSASITKPEYEQAKTRYDSARASVDAAGAAQANARAAVEQTELALQDTSLRAPFGGWITARNIETGRLVQNSTVGFSIIDTRLVKAIFAAA